MSIDDDDVNDVLLNNNRLARKLAEGPIPCRRRFISNNP